MSQVFAGDSVNVTGPVNIPTTTETTAATGNFVNPPFQTAKAIVIATVCSTTGTGTSLTALKIYRNPNAENLLLVGPFGVNWGSGVASMVTLQVADAIPDGRPVQYRVTVTQSAATANGTINFANITTMLISG